jgi:Zn-dependent protease
MWNMMPNPYPGGGLFTRLAVLLGLLFVATFAHELGHAAAVRWTGGQIKVFMVTPFRLQMKPRRLRLAMAGGRGDIGGYVTYTLDRIGARRGHAIIAAAGPVANILLACGAMLVAVAVDVSGQTWLVRRRYIALAEALAVVSMGMALLNLIPFKGSDGDQILHALSSRHRRTRG